MPYERGEGVSPNARLWSMRAGRDMINRSKCRLAGFLRRSREVKKVAWLLYASNCANTLLTFLTRLARRKTTGMHPWRHIMTVSACRPPYRSVRPERSEPKRGYEFSCSQAISVHRRSVLQHKVEDDTKAISRCFKGWRSLQNTSESLGLILRGLRVAVHNHIVHRQTAKIQTGGPRPSKVLHYRLKSGTATAKSWYFA